MEILNDGSVIPRNPIEPSDKEKPYSFLMGDFHPPIVLKIPPGVAHGLEVLQGPAHLLYVASHEYDGSDEGRIAYDALGYNWHAETIK